MNLSLVGKTALVCGSSQGIGLATAKELALLGANLILIARNSESLANAVSQLATTNNQNHQFLVADFMIPNQVKSVIQDFLGNNPSPEILINNTGGPSGGELIDETSDKFLDYFQAHLINNQTLAQSLIPGMRAAGYGRIVNIISTSVKQPIPGLGVSNTIRGAVASWAKTLSIELGPYGITVNNVLPGLTETARLASVIAMRATKSGLTEEETRSQLKASIPIKRFLAAEEVGAAAAFLCTPTAGGINGINLLVDGGNTASL